MPGCEEVLDWLFEAGALFLLAIGVSLQFPRPFQRHGRISGSVPHEDRIELSQLPQQFLVALFRRAGSSGVLISVDPSSAFRRKWTQLNRRMRSGIIANAGCRLSKPTDAQSHGAPQAWRRSGPTGFCRLSRSDSICPCAGCCGWRRVPAPGGRKRRACRRYCASGFSPSAR
jgi:hypothetical protein